MSLENLNETSSNLIKALDEYFSREKKVVSIKAIYDLETKIVEEIIYGDTDKPYIELTVDQLANYFPLLKYKVENNKLVQIKKVSVKNLSLVEGKRWFTDKKNMLIIGKDKGWDERGNN